MPLTLIDDPKRNPERELSVAIRHVAGTYSAAMMYERVCSSAERRALSLSIHTDPFASSDL